jgi:hypothetical protein
MYGYYPTPQDQDNPSRLSYVLQNRTGEDRKQGKSGSDKYLFRLGKIQEDLFRQDEQD